MQNIPSSIPGIFVVLIFITDLPDDIRSEIKLFAATDDKLFV